MNIRLIVDAMGGDHAPDEIIEGVIKAIKEQSNIEILLVGEKEKLAPLLAKFGNKYKPFISKISIIPSGPSIGMNESAAMAVKLKKDSSIVLGLDLIREGKGDAFISAGNTGAVMAATLLRLGRVKGIIRPAIAVTLPTASKPVVLIDAGANMDCKPQNLLQFAIMGTAFSKHILGIENPTVGLLNVGQEKGKGDDLVKPTHDLLENSVINFYGNIEGRDVSAGTTDVVVCDGFIGNVVLKTMEGMASVMFKELKGIINATPVNKVGGILLSNSLKKLQKKLNQDTYGGAHLLGTNGVCIISHGSAKREAIKNAILFAKKSVEQEIVKNIKMEAENE